LIATPLPADLDLGHVNDTSDAASRLYNDPQKRSISKRSAKRLGLIGKSETPMTHVHVIEPFVDLLEVTVVGDKLVDPELAVHVVYRAKRS
jgi:hypothetical protein